MSQSTFSIKSHNPDILTCIANLSNDEVLTPPALANQMLDSLQDAWSQKNGGNDIWTNEDLTFLDPCTKSGVFLREIVKRLNVGLSTKIPDLATRIDHILTKQIFGIGITELTSLLSRRSLYCSKYANGLHSVARTFSGNDGNLKFTRLEHSWNANRCRYCGASKAEYGRDKSLENHAYALIHTENARNTIENLFGEKMHFDVIVGNPPYQLSDGGGGGSARPIYQLFIEQAMKLEPRYLVMVTPSRWFAGGRGLDNFRKKMLEDGRLSKIVDFVQEKDAFPNVNINGGVNFFVWDRDYKGKCEVTTIASGGARSEKLVRSLNEFDIFVRRNEAIPILHKVKSKNEKTFDYRVSSLKPFGLRTFYHGSTRKTNKSSIKLYGSGKISWVSEDEIESNSEWVKKWKVLIPRATDGNENYPLPVWDQVGPFVSGPGEACTETYLIASLAKNKTEAENIVSYMRTKFFRFMVSLRKGTQDNKASIFSFVPDLSLDKKWSDEELFVRYELSDNDIQFIHSMIRDIKY